MTAAAPDTEREMQGLERRLLAIRARLDALGSELFEFWSTRGPDWEHGGVHGHHDRRGVPSPSASKSLVQQARHLWAFATWYARREPTPAVRALADCVYRFLIERFLDADGELFHRVSRDGRRVLEPKKQLYAQSFAIFSLATYGSLCGVAEAVERAHACFRSIDARAHDALLGGYDQTRDPGWLSPGAQKDTNTHIHLLEALTALYRAGGDVLVRARLLEMVDVVAHALVQPSAYTHKEFSRNFRPHGPAVVSYGHDLETAWLLFDALEALALEDADVGAIAFRLGVSSAEQGYDAEQGGYYEEGVPGAAPTKRAKIWWVQAEAIAGLWWLHRRSGDPSFLARLEGTLDWIETRQRDPEYGEWYWGIEPDGSVGPRGDHKGEEWKTSYHGVRAMVFTSDWITSALARGSAGAELAP